jgi:hypothetical protein
VSDKRLDFDAKSIDDIFRTGNSYHVPLYQRGYAWSGDEEVKLLLADLETAFNERPSEFYLLGQAIFCKSEDGSWEVVDGQQRLTTLFLFLALAWTRLNEAKANFDFNTRAFVDTITTMVLNIDEGDHSGARLAVAKSGRSFVEAIISGQELPEDDIDPTQENIRSAVEEIVSWMGETFEEDKNLVEFTKFVLRKVTILTLVLDDTRQALRVFQKMNNRGLTLDDADLLKNLLFVKATDSEFKKLSDSWDTATQSLFKARLRRVRSMEFLMKALVGIETGKSIPTSEVFETWEKQLRDQTVAQAFAYALDNRANSLQFATHNKAPDGTLVSETPGTYMFKWVQHFQVLLAGDGFAPRSYRELADVVENRAMLSMLSGEKNQDFERVVHKWSHAIRELSPSATRKEILTASAVVLGNLDELLLDLRREVPKLSYKTQSQRNKLRYVLARTSQAVEAMADSNYSKNELLAQLIKPTMRGVRKYHIDHIYPQSERQSSSWRGPSEILHSIGNLTLLHPDDNQAQADMLPTEVEKQVNFAGSKLIINQALCGDDMLRNVQSRVASAVQQVKAHGETDLNNWDESQIRARENQYLEILVADFEASLRS